MAGGGARATAFRALILLDTNVVSAVMLQRPEPAVVAWLDQVDPRQVWLPSVVFLSCAVAQPFTRMRAGIALTHQAQLATRNLRHFSDTGLSLINPFPEPLSP